MKFRLATKEDKNQLKKLDSISANTDIFNGEKSFILNKKGLIDFYLNKKGLLVIEDKGQIIGYVLSQQINWMHGIKDLVWIEHICIHPNYRNKGIGKKLLKYVKKYYKGKAQFLYGEIHPLNKISQALFKSCKSEFVDRILVFIKL